MSQADQQQRRSGHRRSKFSLEPVASPAALLDVFQSVGDAAAQRNPAGAVLQLVRCTQAVGEAPLKLGVASSAGDAWRAAGGAAVCERGEDFPTVLFQRWLAVLQQAGKRLPFKAENWETVTGVIEEGRRQVAAAGLACGAAAEEAQQLAATHLAACRALEAAAAAAHEAAPAPPPRLQQPGASAAAPQQQQQPEAAQPTTSGRGRRRAAVAAQAAIVAAVEDGEEGGHEDVAAAAGRRRHSAGPPGSESPGDQENAGGTGQQLQRACSTKLAAKRISGVAGAAVHAKHALQPAAGGGQQEGGQAAKRQRH